LSTKGISIGKPHSLPHDTERFLVDSDIDPELVYLLRKVGLKATHATWQKVPNDDTEYLKWARKRGYILVNHDKHRDNKAKYSFYSEMYYRGGRVIRVGKPGQPTLRLLGCILAQRHVWSAHFVNDSGEASVHPSGCNFTSAAQLFERSQYSLRLPFEDPTVPLKERLPSKKHPKRKKLPNPDQLGPLIP
jgi:hypothetical protein